MRSPKVPVGGAAVRAAVAAIASGLLAVACASAPGPSGRMAGQQPDRVELAQVPFFVQQAHQCGPASLAMALAYAGFPATPEALVPLAYTPSRQGSLPLDLLGAARRSGALAVRLPPGTGAVLDELAAGNPVVVLQNLGTPQRPAWHYAVAIGYDTRSGRLLLRSGPHRHLETPLSRFEASWREGGSWAMVALAPGTLPRSVGAEEYAEAVVTLERLGNTAAAQAGYAAGLERWPGNLALLMGAGNTAYAQGDLQGAERAFARASEAHPRSDAALNNLAHVVARLDRLEEARAIAMRAVAQGGPAHDTAKRTLAEIEAQLADR